MVESDFASKHKKLFKFSSLIILVFVATTASLVLWFLNTIIPIFKTHSGDPLSPSRWLLSVLIPLFFAVFGLRKGSVSISGAILGFFIGMALTMASYSFAICLLVMFMSSSEATKFRSHIKKKLEKDFKEAGQRNWVQVMCNGSVAGISAVCFIVDSGCSDLPIDFYKHYRQSWLSIAVLGSIAAANGDTWASEFGSVLSSSDPLLITTLRRVPKGTNGGVSVWGLIVSAAGGFVVGLSFWIAIRLLCVEIFSTQWPVIVCGTAAGFFGSLVDSLLGATLQYSGLDKNGFVVEQPGGGTKHISGMAVLDNHSVNLLTTASMAFLTPQIASVLWV